MEVLCTRVKEAVLATFLRKSVTLYGSVMVNGALSVEAPMQCPIATIYEEARVVWGSRKT